MTSDKANGADTGIAITVVTPDATPVSLFFSAVFPCLSYQPHAWP